MKIKFTVIFALLILILTGCSGSKSVSIDLPEPDYWPTDGWQVSPPEAQGMDSDLLTDMVERISSEDWGIHSVIVIRNGYLVTEAYFHPYTPEVKEHVQSITKSIVGAAIGIAIQDGMIKSENDKLADYISADSKNSLRLEHLLTMSSGLDCQEFSGSATKMEDTSDWTQYVLTLPSIHLPGKVFSYCNGNAHLLSAVISAAAEMEAREFINQKLFQALNIDQIEPADWLTDPKGISIGGYGLHLQPLDLAKFAFLYLHNGHWDNQQIISAEFVSKSTTQQIQKEDGSGYGYLWTVYPDSGRFSALGLGGQQIHVYPSQNLIVVVTAGLEAYAEAPEIETMLAEYILPSIKADSPLEENQSATARLEEALRNASYPLEPVTPLPEIAAEISGSIYTFAPNPVGWKSLSLNFVPDASTADLFINEKPYQFGLDNIYRSAEYEDHTGTLLRADWIDADTLVFDYPYSLAGPTKLGELGAAQISITFFGETIEVSVEEVIFGGGPITLTGTIE